MKKIKAEINLLNLIIKKNALHKLDFLDFSDFDINSKDNLNHSIIYTIVNFNRIEALEKLSKLIDFKKFKFDEKNIIINAENSQDIHKTKKICMLQFIIKNNKIVMFKHLKKVINFKNSKLLDKLLEKEKAYDSNNI